MIQRNKYKPDCVSIFDDISDCIPVVEEEYPKEYRINFYRHSKKRDIYDWEIRAHRIVDTLYRRGMTRRNLKKMIYYELLEPVGNELEI